MATSSPVLDSPPLLSSGHCIFSLDADKRGTVLHCTVTEEVLPNAFDQPLKKTKFKSLQLNYTHIYHTLHDVGHKKLPLK